MLKRIVCLALFGAFASSVANAQPVTLRLETYAGPTHIMNTQAWPEWIKRVEEASGGEIKVVVSHPPVDPRLMLDRVTDGISDISWASYNYTSGRFTLAEIADLPHLGGNAEQRSIAFWRTHERYLDKLGEHKNGKLLTVFTHGPGMLHLRDEMKGLQDLKGRKVRMAGRVQTELTKLLGAVGVTAPVSKANEMLRQGVVDGALFSIETVTTFKLEDSLRYHYNFPGGLYSSGFFAVMNQAKFDSLTAKQKQALLSVSGEMMAASFGKAWDKADSLATEALKKKGNSVINVDDATAREVAAKLKPIEDEWIRNAKAAGLQDAPAALDFYRAEVKKLQQR